jgi:hypothetical protein
VSSVVKKNTIVFGALSWGFDQSRACDLMMASLEPGGGFALLVEGIGDHAVDLVEVV